MRHSRGPTTPARLAAAVRRAEVVLVGDYHTHPQAQRAFFRLLRDQPAAPITVALEMLRPEHQRAVDRFLAGTLDEPRFLARIGYAASWPFGSFDSFRPIFDLARSRGWRVIGIDAPGPLDARDRVAAEQVVAALEHGRVFVLIGDLHLAPPHLPRCIARTAAPRSPEIVRVHQSPDAIWFDYAARGLAVECDIVEIDDSAFALLTTSPVACQQTFLTWLEQTQEGGPAPTFEPETQERNVHHAIEVIDQALELGAEKASEGLMIAGPSDLRFFEDLAASGAFTRQELREIKNHILSVESCYIPKTRTIYLATLSVNHAAEESAHMLRHWCSGEGLDEPQGHVDAFYYRVMNEAIAFVGSKIVNPKRKCTHLEELEREDPEDSPLERLVASYVVEHKRMERGELTPRLAEVFHAPPEVFNGVTHALGYILGDQLYYALVRGQMRRSTIRSLYYEPLEDEGQAMLMYFELAQRVRRTRIPHRS